jgi:hypothetical protein
VAAGDTLQSIAARLYANPSLWYVIADANGLKGSEILKPGTRLTIPNTIESGRLTADTHTVYHESDIVGSKLPNLKSPPPSIVRDHLWRCCWRSSSRSSPSSSPSPRRDSARRSASALIAGELPTTAALIAGATGGAAGVSAVIGVEGGLSGAAIAGALIGGVVGGAIGGALAGFAGSALTQGVQIAMGLQKSFDWKQLAADIGGGALGGIGTALSAGVSAIVKVAQLAVNVGRIARVAAVLADTAVNVAAEAVQQAATHDGRIEQPWMLAVAGGAVLGFEVVGGLASRAFKSEKGVTKALTGAATPDSAGNAVGKQVRFADGVNIDTKPASALNFKSTETKFGAAFKKVDAKTRVTTDGKQSLDVLDASAGGNNAIVIPKSANDIEAFAVSNATAASKLDQVADVKTVDSLGKLKAGETAEFSKDTVADVAETSLGKVKKPEVPIVEAKVVSGPDDESILRNLIDEVGETRLAKDPDAVDLNVIPTKYYLPEIVAKAKLPKGVQKSLKENVFTSETKANDRLYAAFQKAYRGGQAADAPESAATRFGSHQADLIQRLQVKKAAPARQAKRLKEIEELRAKGEEPKENVLNAARDYELKKDQIREDAAAIERVFGLDKNPTEAKADRTLAGLTGYTDFAAASGRGTCARSWLRWTTRKVPRPITSSSTTRCAGS